MNIKAIVNKPQINFIKDKLYEVEDVIIDTYKIKIPMKQKNKFRYALIKDDEGILV